MVDSMDNIARQAHQGSVSAIIQVLNEKLATSGIRTRAVFAQGMLQLLCEAATPEQLEQSVLVPHIRQVLESIQPRRIRRVNINSRIVREQQLLWLEEISRDPHNQILWSEEILLSRPNFVQSLLQDWKHSHYDPKAGLPKASPARIAREKRLFWRGLIGGASLSIFLLLVGWAVHDWLNSRVPEQTQANITPANPSTSPTLKPKLETADPLPSPVPANAASPVPTNSVASSPDPFAQAVLLAEQSVTAGQLAQTPAEWLALATQWQQASDLMSQVLSSDPRYETAQSRVKLYRQNSEAALKQAENSR
ncbi:MAG: hypothetical protein HC769_15340 [Cyanobacteria bacterium CRU_2_1]|nr:hypothetical protein [Cyanobacteria bacterium RU_5_0]NJR60089.1 hypothetical protein [Cyanobacteria bacterium CRU_2_1]